MGWFNDWGKYALLGPGGFAVPDSNSGGGGGYEFKPYSGLRPPRIDTKDKEILRPTQAQTYDILMKRSRGEGVGYDPQRRELLAKLVKNELAAQEEDQLRSAEGAISQAGLSGNPRAYEALAGRVKRDTGRNLENSMSRIAIEDLTRANEERDINTARLQDLNTFNFGQENNRANFDLSVYGAEEGNRMNAANFNEGIRRYDTGQKNDMLGGLAELAGTGVGAYFGGPAGAVIGSQAGRTLAGGDKSGYGISPNYSGVAPTYSGHGPKEYIGSKAGYRNYRNLSR